MKVKRTLKPIFCLFAALALLLPVLSSCAEDAPKLTMEEMQDRMRFYIDSTDFSVPNELADRTTEEKDDFVKSDNIIYNGVKYALQNNGYIQKQSSDFCKDTVCSFSGVDENGKTISVAYTDPNKLPLRYFASSSIFGEEGDKFDFDTALKISEDFIEEVINLYAEEEIDLSDYTFEKLTNYKNAYQLHWVLYYRSVKVHELQIDFDNYCRITGYEMSAPIISKQFLECIPELSEEQYLELAREVLKDNVAKENGGVAGELREIRMRSSFKNIFPDTLGDCIELVYIKEADCYAVCFVVEQIVEVNDISYALPIHCYYMLAPNAESEEG
ncbi:MAG: hypothetical protein IKM32_02165 [Clostridia bacterium]|nr:hypothetical protein [Clostridia bacterium]